MTLILPAKKKKLSIKDCKEKYCNIDTKICLSTERCLHKSISHKGKHYCLVEG
jgi:hypothetical protein